MKPSPNTTTVFCTLQMPGLHNWQHCSLDEVSYLQFPHRHMFHVKAFAPVSHEDRDVEFIQMKNKISEYLRKKYWDSEFRCLVFGSMSCEMIAAELIREFDLVSCEVSEDGENGAVVTTTSTPAITNNVDVDSTNRIVLNNVLALLEHLAGTSSNWTREMIIPSIEHTIQYIKDSRRP